MMRKSGSDRAATAASELAHHRLQQNEVLDALVVMRALKCDLVLELDRGGARSFQFLDGAARVDRVAEADAAVDDEGDGRALRDLPRRRRDLSERQQRLRDGELEAERAAAEVGGRVAEVRERPCGERIEADWREDGPARFDQLTQTRPRLHR